jgi:hypothetical protein
MTTTTTWNEPTPARADNVEIAPRISEDWLSLIIGLFIFVLALAGIANVDLLGWLVTTSTWTEVSKALGTVSKSYAWLGGFGALVATYLAPFFSIGVLSNFKKLWQEGIGRLAAVYFVSLFGFVIWVGLLISWLFFSGVKPPLAS